MATQTYEAGESNEGVKPLALRPDGASKALSISTRTLWARTAPRGPIPCLRIGEGKRQIVLYPVAGLEAWLADEAAKSLDPMSLNRD